jgi:cytochrome c-L
MKKIKYVAIAALAGVAVGAAGALAQGMTFYHTITGEDLKIPESTNPEGRDTEGVKLFLQTGNNPYNDVASCLHEGEQTFLASCSGCHGHFGEGKVGPGLNDAYWTYPKNKTDKGLLETIYGGAQGMMGPHSDLPLDETLKLMAWIRHLYTGDVAEADWLTDEQKAAFKPFVEVKGGDGGETKTAANASACKPSGG